MYKCNEARLKESIEAFSQFGATDNGRVTRLSLTKEDIRARDYFCASCKEFGMEIKFDDMANIYAVLPGKRDLPPIVIGSHLDSVENGGIFDGVLGILTALEAVRTICQNEIELEMPLVIVNFTNKEGTRFAPPLMGSGVISSKFEKNKLLQSVDRNDVTFKEALEASGYAGVEANRLQKASAYIELHIEQDSVLTTKEMDIGVVEGVLGTVCYEVTISSEPNQIDTPLMTMRKDPLFIAAKWISKLDEQFGTIDKELVYTIGQMNVTPNTHTVIPRQIVFTIYASHQDPKKIEQVESIINRLPNQEKGCTIILSKLWSLDTTMFEPSVCKEIEQSCENYGYSSHRLYSGAGYDAQLTASYIPSAMILVPGIRSKSHCDEEETMFKNCVKAADVLLETVLTLQTKLAMKATII